MAFGTDLSMAAPMSLNILTINAGSSSLKLARFSVDEAWLKVIDRSRLKDVAHGLSSFLPVQFPIDVVVHRVVHGGSQLSSPCEIDSTVEREIAQQAHLAPLHNHVAL